MFRFCLIALFLFLANNFYVVTVKPVAIVNELHQEMVIVSITAQTHISTPSSELFSLTDRISTVISFQPDLTIRKKRLSKFPNPFSHSLQVIERIHVGALSASIHYESISHFQHCISLSTELRV